MKKFIKEPEHRLISIDAFNECVAQKLLNPNSIQIIAILKNGIKVSSQIEDARSGMEVVYEDISTERTKPKKKKRRTKNSRNYEQY